MKFKPYILVFAAMLTACSEVPKEAPQLSMTIGSDITAMQTAHRQLVRELFLQIRRERENYLTYEWTPKFIKNFAQMGKIREIAKGELVFNETTSQFVAPTPGQAEIELLNSINGWSQEAIRQIEKKRKTLLDPIDAKQEEILTAIDSAYSKMLAANSQVTGFLTSLRDVQEMQDGLLQNIGLGGARQDINNTLISVSDWANKGLEHIREADQKIK